MSQVQTFIVVYCRATTFILKIDQSNSDKIF